MNKTLENAEYWQSKYENLVTQYQETEQKIAELEKRIQWYEEQFRLAKHQQFGRSSEQTSEYIQPGLFNEIETEYNPKLPEPAYEQITYRRQKPQASKKDKLENLPVETIEYTLPEVEQSCPSCGNDLHKMSQKVRKELKIIPAQVSIIEHVQYVYSCRNCEKHADSVPIITAHGPEPLIKGSLASPSAVAHIIEQKYQNAVPLYRQEQSLLNKEIYLSRQTMANWLIRCSEDYLSLIYNRLKEKLLTNEILHADETVLQVLKEPGKKANTNSYMWLYRSGKEEKEQIVIYEYQPTRSSSHPKKFLAEFKGYLHTDGYSGYHSLPGITVIGCFAHARRKFAEALKAIGKDQQIGSPSAQGLEYCNQLFRLEKEYENLTPEERLEKRLEKSKPLAEEFLDWAEKANPLPGFPFGKAIKYLKEQWPYLSNVFLDGRLELSNNRAERSIKPFVIGRKNWLFSNSQKGAQASSIIYSIMETAKENGLRPFEYFEYLLTEIPNYSISSIDKLLPWSDALPPNCKASSQP